MTAMCICKHVVHGTLSIQFAADKLDSPYTSNKYCHCHCQPPPCQVFKHCWTDGNALNQSTAWMTYQTETLHSIFAAMPRRAARSCLPASQTA